MTVRRIAIASSGAPARRRWPAGASARRRWPGARIRRAVVVAPSAGAIAARRACVAVAVGGASTLLYGGGHLSYDAAWALLWGRQISEGQLPAFQAPGAPTPHPLINLVAALLSPLGDAAGTAFVLIGALSFGLLTLTAYLLGARLFGRPAGALFALLLFVSPQLVALQGQAPIDIPFLACVILAAAIEAARSRGDGAVFVALIFAGLIRPEAWLFTGAYALYRLRFCEDLGGRLRVLALAALAPLVWAACDLLVTGDALYSLHGTRELAAALQRPTGFATAISAMPVALVEALGTTLALTGLAGCVAAMLVLYRRSLLPLALLGIGLSSFAALGLCGLPVLNRYLIVPVAVVMLFAAVALVGWAGLHRDHPLRRPWMAGSAVLAAMLAFSLSATVQRDRGVASMLHAQRAIEGDLHALAAASARAARGPRTVHVATRRAVPLLAVWLDLPLASVSADQPRPGSSALLIRPATPEVALRFASATTPAWPSAPDQRRRPRELYRNRSWTLSTTVTPSSPARQAS
jgi:hypothetical protein